MLINLYKRDEDDMNDTLDEIFDSSDRNSDTRKWLKMASMTFGGWGVNPKSPWEEKLEYVSDNVIKRTGMSRNELTKLLKYLDEQNIIR